MVEGMSLVVNVMLSLMSVMSPPSALCNPLLRTVVKCGCFDFRGELGFLNFDYICVCGDVGGVGESGWATWARVWGGVVVLCLCVL